MIVNGKLIVIYGGYLVHLVKLIRTPAINKRTSSEKMRRFIEFLRKKFRNGRGYQKSNEGIS